MIFLLQCFQFYLLENLYCIHLWLLLLQNITIPYENHSKGSQTTVWGKAWFYENVQKYHTSHMISNFMINDFNSNNNGGLTEKTIFGPDNKEYDNIVSKEQWIENVKDIMDLARVNNIQPIYIGASLTNAHKLDDVDHFFVTEWHIALLDSIDTLSL